MITVNR